MNGRNGINAPGELASKRHVWICRHGWPTFWRLVKIILMEKRASTLLVRCEEGFHCEYTGDTRASGNLHPAVVATDLWLNKFSIFKSHWLRDHQDTHWTSLILAVRHRLQQCCLIFTVSSMVVRCPYKRILKEPAMTTGTHTSPHSRNEYFNSTQQKLPIANYIPTATTLFSHAVVSFESIDSLTVPKDV